MVTIITKTQFKYDSASKTQVIKREFLGVDLRFYPTAEKVLQYNKVTDAIATAQSLRITDPVSVYSVDIME
jgi:hypothetical protein